jgi:hypothetical protein
VSAKPVSVFDGRKKHLGLAVPSDNAAWFALDAAGRDLGRFANLRAASPPSTRASTCRDPGARFEGTGYGGEEMTTTGSEGAAFENERRNDMTINENPSTVGAVPGAEAETNKRPPSTTTKARRKGKRRKLTDREYWRLRATLPYGVWRERGTGCLVLFNRDYRPIWRMTPDGATTTPVTGPIHLPSGKSWIENDAQVYCWGDWPSPWFCEKTRAWCEQILRWFNVPDDAQLQTNRTVATL